MLVAERLISRFSHDHSHHVLLPADESTSSGAPKPPAAGDQSHVEFDVELGELERAEGIEVDQAMSAASRSSRLDPASDSKGQAYSLTLGLIVHALADGFALGSSAITPVDTRLSLVVFLALVVHKGQRS